MSKITYLKPSLVAVCFMALIACSGTTKTVQKQTGESSTAMASKTVDKSADSSWQQAYGEPLDAEPNTLESVAPKNPSAAQQITPAPLADLWQRIRNGYAMSEHEHLHKDTQRQLKWFVTHPDYVNRVVERARPYLHYIVDQLEQRNMPLEIALLPVVESGFQPFAYSHGRAAGLWQFIPGTGELYGLSQNWWYDGRRDIIESTRAALDYLQKLHNDFNDWELALAAYNCGEGTVGRAIKRNKKAGKPTDFWSLDLPRETSAYVPKLMAVAHMVKQPQKYDISLSPIDNSPFLTVVDIGSQIDLALAAEMAQISIDDLYQLNPGFNRWATAPDGPHHLVIPLDKVDVFQQALQALPEEERVQWTRHKIQAGDTLGVIAKHYHTTIDVIKKANGINGNTIRAGQHLLIPVASGQPSEYPLTVSQRLANRQNSAKSGNKKTYTVKAGDTWWDIARNHSIGVRTLAKWNGKAPGDMLHPGQKLVIWEKSSSKQATTASNKLQTVNYTIRNGDSLWKISQKFNVSVAQVREWNGLSERTLLQPGQKLTLYVDVTKQHGRI